jgi:hypothetical protein
MLYYSLNAVLQQTRRNQKRNQERIRIMNTNVLVVQTLGVDADVWRDEMVCSLDEAEYAHEVTKQLTVAGYKARIIQREAREDTTIWRATMCHENYVVECYGVFTAEIDYWFSGFVSVCRALAFEQFALCKQADVPCEIVDAMADEVLDSYRM